jgi:hypothetical protein
MEEKAIRKELFLVLVVMYVGAISIVSFMIRIFAKIAWWIGMLFGAVIGKVPVDVE